MEPMLNGNDFNNLRDAVKETGSFKQAIVLHRFVSFSGGAVNGVSQTRNVNDITVMARIHTVSSKDVLLSGGYYQDGDLVTDSEYDIIGVSNVKSKITQADTMTYDGENYIVVGKPQKKFGAGGRLYTKTLWRRI